MRTPNHVVTALLLSALLLPTALFGQEVSDTSLVAETSAEIVPAPDLRLDSLATLDSLLQRIARLEAAFTDVQRSTADSTFAWGGGDFRQARQLLPGIFWKTIRSLVAILIVFFLIRALSWILEVLAERNATRRLLFKRMIPIVRILLWGFAVYFILSVVFQVTQQQMLAASAAVGVAVGFASQDVLKNIFGGVLIILDKPFQVGDKIRVGGTYGEVVSIGLRATRIVTPDDNLVSVPNAQIVDSQVANANAGNLHCQVVTNLYLPGWVDVMKAKAIAYDAAANSQYVYLEKPIVVYVRDEFRETFLTQLIVKAYVIDTRYENRFSSDITEASKAEFLRLGMLRPIVDMATVTQSHLKDHIDFEALDADG